MVRACGRYRREEHTGFLWGILQERDHLEDQSTIVNKIGRQGLD